MTTTNRQRLYLKQQPIEHIATSHWASNSSSNLQNTSNRRLVFLALTCYLTTLPLSPKPLCFLNLKAPKVTFKKPIGSVSVSGHKFVGCPMPCGVQITRLKHINALSRDVEYLASRDAMIMGSRNGHAPIFLWYTLNRKGYRGFQKEVQKCLRNAHYLKDRLISAGIGAVLNELSSTVVFAHVVVMPNITIDKLDDFLNELVQKRAAWFQDGKLQPPCIASDVGKENCLCALHK